MWPFKKHIQEPSGEGTSPAELLEVMSQLSDQVARFIRWSYRSQKVDGETLAEIKDLLERVHQQAHQSETQLRSQLDYVARGMISWLDDLDTLAKSANTETAIGHDLVRHWSSQLLDQLKVIGYEEITVYGKPFDPSVAEALGTSAKWPDSLEPPSAYSVISVLRRGFHCTGTLHRKAQVIVYNEGSEEPLN